MVDQEQSMQLDLRDLVVALSEALGLVDGKITDHGKRVAFIALTLAQRLPVDPAVMPDLRTACLLHDAGVSSTVVYKKLQQLDWPGVDEHCREGADRLQAYPPFRTAARIIRLHHTRWDRLPNAPEDRPLGVLANLIFLADRIDALLDWDQEFLVNRRRIEARIADLSGTYFNPEAVQAFIQQSRVEVFWLSLYSRHLPRALAQLPGNGPMYMTMDDLETVAGIFAHIVDHKSSYTRGHSPGVARLAHLIGARMGLPSRTVQKLRIAALFHDLGKLVVPDEILEKPADLTPDEFQIIKRHPFETYQILSGLPGLDDIRDWAAFHHEKPDGSGYPFRLSADRLQREHIIIKLSDIIQALLQERPYRSGLAEDHLMDILDHMAAIQANFKPLLQVIRRDFIHVARVAEGTEALE